MDVSSSQNLELGSVPTLFKGRNGPEKQSGCRCLGLSLFGYLIGYLGG